MNEVHDHVQILRVLEATPKIHDERMLYSEQQTLFIVCVLYLLHPHDFLFVQDLDRIVTEIVSATD